MFYMKNIASEMRVNIEGRCKSTRKRLKLEPATRLYARPWELFISLHWKLNVLEQPKFKHTSSTPYTTAASVARRRRLVAHQFSFSFIMSQQNVSKPPSRALVVSVFSGLR